MLKPIAYDFDPRFDLPSLDGLNAERLRVYKQERLVDLQQLIGGALADLELRHELIDWFDWCARLSEKRAVDGRRLL